MKWQVVPNTLRVPCRADDFRVARGANELGEMLAHADARGEPAMVVGGGSNLVLRARLPGLVVQPRIRGLAFERLDERRWRLVAGAGETWQEAVRASLGRGIAGLENLILIPGSVGAAPVQNIGAYGRELAEVLESVTVIDRERGAVATLGAQACKFRYRDSRFKRDGARRYVIVRVSLVLGGLATNAGYLDVRRELGRMGVLPSRGGVAEAVARTRRRKLPDPRRIGNVGSFFQNPRLTAAQLDALRALVDVDAYVDGDRFKIPAARLIERAGWKGVRRGAVQVWPRQPLVLVNHGGASGCDVLAMADRIRDDVANRYGVFLELEPAVKGVD